MDASSKSNFVWWFKFCPHKFAKYIAVSDAEAGKRFKEMLSCLLANDAPDDSVELEMINDAMETSRKQRERAMARWRPEEKKDTDTPQTNSRPSRPSIPRPAKPKKIDLRDIYDWCDANNVPPPVGKEFFDYNESTGWNITTTWQNALKGFVKSKLKNRSK